MNLFKRRHGKKYFLKKYKLEKEMKDVWLAAGVHMSDKKIPPVWDEKGDYISNKTGDILPMVEVEEGLFAYYKIVRSKRKSGGDWLYNTDAWNYDLEFTHIGEFKIRWE